MCYKTVTLAIMISGLAIMVFEYAIMISGVAIMIYEYTIMIYDMYSDICF